MRSLPEISFTVRIQHAFKEAEHSTGGHRSYICTAHAPSAGFEGKAQDADAQIHHRGALTRLSEERSTHGDIIDASRVDRLGMSRADSRYWLLATEAGCVADGSGMSLCPTCTRAQSTCEVVRDILPCGLDQSVDF